MGTLGRKNENGYAEYRKRFNTIGKHVDYGREPVLKSGNTNHFKFSTRHNGNNHT